MNEPITLVLEDENEKTQQMTCNRFAIMVNNKELWVQSIDGQLFIGTDIAETDTEFTNIVMRPMATNLVSLQLEIEAMDPEMIHSSCCEKDDCECDHH